MTRQAIQQHLPLKEYPGADGERDETVGKRQNSVAPQDRPIHDWYRFVLSFPPHLVREYIEDFQLADGATVLDPFCGTGTTVVEAKLRGLNSIGIEANPFPHFASCVKTDWSVNPSALAEKAAEIARNTQLILSDQGISEPMSNGAKGLLLRKLPEAAAKTLIKNSISPLPLHKTLVLLEQINRFRHCEEHGHFILALGNALTNEIGNLRFGPEVGVGKIKSDVPVTNAWTSQVRKMADDLRKVQGPDYPDAMVHLADARDLGSALEPSSVDAVITSPPYPNEKDYTRTTRLESVVLGFYEDMAQLRRFKKTLLRSNTRGIYKDDNDDSWVSGYARIQQIAERIEQRRIQLGKTSGFEKLYSRATKLYFGGMARHFALLRHVLKPGARLAYVVGDQASYLQVMIRTGELLAEIAQDLGYQVVRIDLFRTRFATATQSELREEVVILKWPG